MGLKWNEIPEDLRTSMESVLTKNSGPTDPTDVFHLLKSYFVMDYKWHEKKEVAESVFSMFRIAFSKEDSFEHNSQRRFASCFHVMAKTGLEWAGLPEEVKLTIFQGIENRSPVRFGPGELSRLFNG
jgi:hypothetical protein